VGPARVEGGVGPGGAEAKGELGGVKAEATFDGNAFGLKAEARKVRFEAKVEKDRATHRWSQWEFKLGVAVVGAEAAEEIPYVHEIVKSVGDARRGLNEVGAHLSGGGSPLDASVRERMSHDVKPAIEAVGKAVQAREQKGPNVTLGAELRGGDPELGTYAGVTATITF
jgi:hypothetical protein